MKIKTPKTTRDDKSFLSMSASQDGGRNSRKKQKKESTITFKHRE